MPDAAAALPLVEVVEYTDPMCSWAWGTEPKLRLLRWRHGHRTTWRTVLGGLVGDSSKGRPDWDPVKAARPLSNYWRQTTGYTGQPYPLPMHRTLRSSDPAGQAVKAAELQGADVAARVLRRFRESIFLFGLAPETPEHFAEAARGVDGLDVDRWLADLHGAAATAAFRSDWEETRRPNEHVRTLTGDRVGIGSMKHSDGHDRYAFPTLLFRGLGGEHTVPGWMPWEAYIDAMEAAVPGSTSDPRPDPTPAEALEQWGVLTAKELSFLCGADAQPPADAVGHDWGAGLVYFRADEAAARGLPAVSPAGVAALRGLRDAFALGERVLEQVGADQWSSATPCEGWDVRALTNHMVGGARMVTYGLQGRDIGPEFYGDHLGDDPLASYRAATAEAVDAYRTDLTILDRTIAMPWGELTGARLADLFMGDHVVHAWDAAKALGIELEVDDALVARAEVLSRDYVGDVRRGPGMFDAAVEPPTDASRIDQLAAYLGRRF